MISQTPYSEDMRTAARVVATTVDIDLIPQSLASATIASVEVDGLIPDAQLPEALEFPNVPKPPMLHYTGPFVDHRQRPPVDFPWERLDARPLVYASLGTLQNGSEEIFRTIAQACQGLDLQLVITLGGGLDPERLGKLSGDPLVVRYAPQLELLKRAALVITHAGLNTVLESLSEGVPMVAIPLGNDQPGVAARVVARGAGLALSRRRLNPQRLRRAVVEVLGNPQYRESARALQRAFQQVDGPERAADLVVEALALTTHRQSMAVAADD